MKAGLFATAIVLASMSAQANEISGVRASVSQFHPQRGEQFSVYFHTDFDAQLNLSIYDGRDRLIRRIGKQQASIGDQELIWDGLDSEGKQVPNEVYSYVVQATNAAGETTTHDLTDLSGGKTVSVTDVKWDAASKTIQFYLPEPARVNLRAGIKNGGPLMGTVLDWVPRQAGEIRETWNGMDASNMVYFADHKSLSLVVTAYSLSDNSVFVGDPLRKLKFAATADAKPLRPSTDTQPKHMRYFAEQPLDTRSDYTALLSVAKGFSKQKRGQQIVSGIVPLRLDVLDSERARVLERRFEVIFFVDNTYTFENETGFLPMTWQWDTRNLSPGEHYITVNIRGYEGNFGAATLKLLVQKDDAPETENAQ